MKKAFSILLAVMLVFCTFPMASFSAEETAAAVSGLNLNPSDTTTTISGDAVNGYKLSIANGEYFAMSKTSSPVATTMFDFGANSVQGRFGISKNGDISTISQDENTIAFITVPYGSGNLQINIRRGGKNYPIADITGAMRNNDALWAANISSYGFAEKDGHWYLTIDGILCNNNSTNIEYAQLDRYFGKSFFDNNESVYVYVGGLNNTNVEKTVFFKAMSITSEDGLWASYAVDTYKWSTGHEYRGQGLNYPSNSNAKFEYSAIPAVALNDEEGHKVDFTGTNGYAQTSQGFDLKKTRFDVSPITTSTSNLNYHIAFTSNPAVHQHHNQKTGETIEFDAISVYSQNNTVADIITNTNGNASPTKIRFGLFSKYKSHRDTANYKSATITLAFVQETGADGNMHWYLQTTNYGQKVTVKSSDAATDAYLQFDSIIDKPVYFRMGTTAKTSDSFSMYCKVIDKSEDGTGGWNSAEKLPTISYDEEVAIGEFKAEIAEFGEVNSNNILDRLDDAKNLIAKYNSFSNNAQAYLSEELEFITTLNELVVTYEPYVNMEIDKDHIDNVTITGDTTNGFKYTVDGSARHRVLYKKGQPLDSFAVDYGHNYSGNLYGEFGVSLINDVTNLDDGLSDENTLSFEIRVVNKCLEVYVRWENQQIRKIATISDKERKNDAYWNANVSTYSFVKVGEHWHLAVDGIVCNNVEENFDYSCLEYMLEDAFDNGVIAYPYFGGHTKGNGFFKPMSLSSEDGLMASYAVDSYKYNANGTLYEYRGQGLNSNANTKFEYSAIPSAPKKDGEGYVVDFTGTNGYAQSTIGYDLKTTKFEISPITTSTSNLNYHIAFTSNPAVHQHHNQKTGETIEFDAISVYSQNNTVADIITNTNGNASPTKIRFGLFSKYKSHRDTANYKSATITLAFVQETGADGNMHWYLQTTNYGQKVTVKSSDAATDAYLQFDNIIDKPVYFRMGTTAKTSDSFSMYCKVNRTTVDAENIYHNLNEGEYAVNFTKGTVIDGTERLHGDTLDTLGVYSASYTLNGTLYSGNIVLYKDGDVNADDVINIRDLVALKKRTVNIRDLDVIGERAADINSDSKIDATDIAELRIKLLS